MKQADVLQTILSRYLDLFCRSLKCVPAIIRKAPIIIASMTGMFCVLWKGGEDAPEFRGEVQESSH